MCKCSNVCKIVAPPPSSEPAGSQGGKQGGLGADSAPHCCTAANSQLCTENTIRGRLYKSSSAFPLVPDKAGNSIHQKYATYVLFPVTKVIFFYISEEKNMIVQVLICLTSQYMGSQKYSIFDSDWPLFLAWMPHMAAVSLTIASILWSGLRSWLDFINKNGWTELSQNLQWDNTEVDVHLTLVTMQTDLHVVRNVGESRHGGMPTTGGWRIIVPSLHSCPSPP